MSEKPFDEEEMQFLIKHGQFFIEPIHDDEELDIERCRWLATIAALRAEIEAKDKLLREAKEILETLRALSWERIEIWLSKMKEK